MGISIHGPSWPTVAYLRGALRDVPEVGEFTIGGRPTNAIDQLVAFQTAELHTPDFTLDRRVAEGWVEGGCTVFGRMLIHTRGNDICLPGRRNRRDQYSRRWSNSEWWSKYVEPTEEWRVHVFNGKSIARGRKIHTGPSWRKAPVRNIGNGWTFDFTGDAPKGLRRTAKAACTSLNYPHGAVDILQIDATPQNGSNEQERVFYVLEVNRIPAVTCPYTRDAWVAAIRRHVSER